MIQVRCSCGTQLETGDEQAGGALRCPVCWREVRVPSVTALPPVKPPDDTAVMPRSNVGAASWEEPPIGSRRERWRDDGRDFRRHGPSSGKALASLVFGLLTFCVPVLLAIPAVILGFLARSDIKRANGRLRGSGMATAGIVLGFAGNLMCVPAFLLLPAVQRARESAARMQCGNHLAMIGIAFHNYAMRDGTLPPAVVYDKDGRPLYSWRVLLLPYMGEDDLYRQFHLDEPWDSPHNIRLLDRMPSVYAHPNARDQDRGLTYFQVFDGPAGRPRPGGRALFVSESGKRVPFLLPGTFRSDHVVNIGRIPDGTSDTILVAEAAEGVPWTKPADLPYDPERPLPKLGGHFRSGYHLLMADGFVQRIDPSRISERTLRLAITADDLQALPEDWPR